jgi:hypothetical protein
MAFHEMAKPRHPLAIALKKSVNPKKGPMDLHQAPYQKR